MALHGSGQAGVRRVGGLSRADMVKISDASKGSITFKSICGFNPNGGDKCIKKLLGFNNARYETVFQC